VLAGPRAMLRGLNNRWPRKVQGYRRPGPEEKPIAASTGRAAIGQDRPQQAVASRCAGPQQGVAEQAAPGGPQSARTGWNRSIGRTGVLVRQRIVGRSSVAGIGRALACHAIRQPACPPACLLACLSHTTRRPACLPVRPSVRLPARPPACPRIIPTRLLTSLNIIL